jgi:hypothetical protein
MEKEPPFTREMTFEEFFPVFAATYLTPGKLNAYMAEHQSPIDYQTLIGFFQHEPVKQLLKLSWNSERNEYRLPKSTIQAVMEQTVCHTLDIIDGFIAPQTRGVITIFQGQPMEYVRQVEKIIFFYNSYFHQVFLGE